MAFKIWQIRSIHTTLPHLKEIAGKSGSSHIWLSRHLNDPYVKKSRYDNYRSRAAYKLLEIDDKYKIIFSGMVAIDAGASPGSWTQVLVNRSKATEPDSKSLIIGLDILNIHPINGAHLLPFTDFTKPLSQTKIIEALQERQVDLFASDMAPNACGVHSLDHEKIVFLLTTALTFSLRHLKPRTGVFLGKLWQGSMSKQILENLERFFNRVVTIKPPASRENSAEIFLLASEFKGLKAK